MTTWPLQRDCPAFYGNPDPDGDGLPNRAWEDENLARITPPWTMVLAWDIAKPLRSFPIHKKCATSLNQVLGVIWAHAGHSQETIEQHGLHLFGGSYNFRLSRHSTRLSTHAYACAIDLSPAANRMGQVWRPEHGMLPMFAVEAFEHEGWVWGGRWPLGETSRPDAMHFQAARVR